MTVPLNRKIVLMCALGKNGAAEAKDLPSTLRATRASIGNQVSLSISTLVEEMGLPPTPHQILTSEGPKPANLVCELSSESSEGWSDLFSAASEVVAQLGSAIDRSRSSAFAGNEVAITSGTGPALLVFGLRRQQNLSHKEFMSHWFGDHLEVGKDVEGVRYKQCHVDEGASKELAARLGFSDRVWDGVVLSYFDDVAAGVALMSSEAVSGAIEDEKAFVDHSQSSFGYYQSITS